MLGVAIRRLDLLKPNVYVSLLAAMSIVPLNTSEELPVASVGIARAKQLVASRELFHALLQEGLTSNV
jgi:hypothetical protein